MERKQIGICVTSLNQISKQIRLEALTKELKKRGYGLLIYAPFSDFYYDTNSEREEKKIYEFMPVRACAGIIMFSSDIKDDGIKDMIVDRAKEAGIPVISLRQPHRDSCLAIYDSVAGIKDATEHLLTRHRCKNVYFIAGTKGIPDSDVREEAFCEVMKEHGYDTEERILYGQFWERPTRAVIEKLLYDVSDGLPMPDGIVCANDAMGIEVCKVLREHSYSVPTDVKVIGMGGLYDRTFNVPYLSTENYDEEKAAIQIVDSLEELMEGKRTNEETIVCQCEPEYTESCGCKKKRRHDMISLLSASNKLIYRERGFNAGMHNLQGIINRREGFEPFIKETHKYIKEVGIKYCYVNLSYICADRIIGTESFPTPGIVNMATFNPESVEIDIRYISDDEVYWNSMKMIDLCGAVMYIPLNTNDGFYGYVAIGFEERQVNFSCLFELVMTINNIIMSVERRETQYTLSLQLSKVSEETILSLAEIVEARSEFTGNHVKRVSEYTRALAKALRYTDSEINNMRIAAMMHDIGKICVPLDILEKPGKLTPEEFEIIKTHASEGHRLLKNAPGEIMEMAAKIALEHHEKWNGKGYAGVAGENISKEARIVAVADVFDALVSKRPYKEKMALDVAYDIIVGDSGSHFDPEVVEAFKKCFEEFKQIEQEFGD